MAIAKRLKDFLKKNGIKYDIEKHREIFTAQQVAASEHITGYKFAKVVILKCDNEMVMAVIPAPHEVSIKKMKALGYKKVELAPEKEFESLFPDCDPGATPPFGNLYNLTFYVDKSFKGEEEIVFNSGTHTETVKIRMEDYDRLVGKDVYVDISNPPAGKL
ncbi:MAG: YbaK/EbsC family protein [candidate division WOR-3 bacterium]|nr:YbaK/EbsC family protein [candidate division WOR-3 bacterium]